MLEALTTRVSALGFTTTAQIPDTGSALFNGSIILNDKGSGALVSVVGGMTLDVDFANASNVTGKAGNFYNLQNERVGGQLDLSNVLFDSGIGGGGIAGDLDGRLTNVGSNRVYDYDLEVGLVYFGNAGQAFTGLISGSATEFGGRGSTTIEGAIVLEQ